MGQIPFFTRLGLVLKSYLTAPDGESYAPGRIMGFILFGWLIWSSSFMVGNVANSPHVITDWVLMMGQLVIYIPALTAACVGLIMGTAPLDSGGKWWGRGASPPPPPTEGTPPESSTK